MIFNNEKESHLKKSNSNKESKKLKIHSRKERFREKSISIKKQKGFKCDSFWSLFSLKGFTFFFLRNLFFSEEDFIFLGVPVLLFWIWFLYSLNFLFISRNPIIPKKKTLFIVGFWIGLMAARFNSNKCCCEDFVFYLATAARLIPLFVLFAKWKNLQEGIRREKYRPSSA